jgi:hypothetical protein
MYILNVGEFRQLQQPQTERSIELIMSGMMRPDKPLSRMATETLAA